MTKICGQVNKPTVDNTALTCKDTFSTKCVFSENAISTLSIKAADDLSKVFTNLNEYLKGLKKEIGDFEYTVKRLEQGLGGEGNKYKWQEDENLVNFLTQQFNSKQPKEEGKGLSTNDYSNSEKEKLANTSNKVIDIERTLDNIQQSLGSHANRISVVERLLEELQAVANKPITITDKSGNSTAVKLGDTLQVKGTSDNVSTRVGDKVVEIVFNEDLSVNSVTAGSVKMSKEGINAGGKKITNLAKANLTDDSREALTAGQFSVIYTEFGRQLTEHERYTQAELDKREKLANKAQELEGGSDQVRYPSVALLKKVKKELGDLIANIDLSTREEKANKSGDINAADADTKYPNLTLLKMIKTDLDNAIQQHTNAISTLQTQIQATDTAVHSAEINAVTSALTLKDKRGNPVGTLSLGFLNNEGTKLAFNQSDKTLEMRNDANELLSSVPLGALVSNLVSALGRDGKKIKLLDSQGTAVSEIDLSPLFDLYTPITRTEQVESDVQNLKFRTQNNEADISSLTFQIGELHSKESLFNKVDDISVISGEDERRKYPSVRAIKETIRDVLDKNLPTAENTEIKTIQSANIIGNIIRIELTHKVDTTKWWSVWVNGVLVHRPAITFTNTMLSIDNVKVGYRIEEGDEVTIQYRVKRD